jgi:hypothetical protein
VTDWQNTEHDKIQVRFAKGDLLKLDLGTYRARYSRLGQTADGKDIFRLPPFEPDGDGLYPLGYEVRVRLETPVKEGRVRCVVCQRSCGLTKSGEPRKHNCDPTDPGWTLLRGMFGTPAKAIAAALAKLECKQDLQTRFNVGDGKKRVA